MENSCLAILLEKCKLDNAFNLRSDWADLMLAFVVGVAASCSIGSMSIIIIIIGFINHAAQSLIAYTLITQSR